MMASRRQAVRACLRAAPRRISSSSRVSFMPASCWSRPHSHFNWRRRIARSLATRSALLLRVARRVVWFEEPARALADPVQFLAHVMVLGTVEDLAALHGIVDKDDYRDVLDHAPPGIFDERTWAYRSLVCERRPAAPMPVRARLQPMRSVT
jgi:hypothetical protein